MTRCANCGGEVPVDKPHQVGECSWPVAAPLKEGERIRLHVGDGKYVDATVGKVEEPSPGWFNIEVHREPEALPDFPRHHLDRWVGGTASSDLSLPDFLLARYAEDQALALAAQTESSTPWWDQEGTLKAADQHSIAGYAGETTSPHIVRHDPARVLADIEAKRRIVGRFFAAEADRGGTSDIEETLHDVLQDLALPYVCHPDFREEWKP